MFLKGLQEGGIPIKFSSWHTYTFGTGGSSNLNLQIQERSRSVKALFAVQRRAPVSMETDSGAMLLCSNKGTDNGANTLQSYQYRIGGRYYPAAPVQVSLTTGSEKCNGGAEAFVELQKALNIMGDYRLATGLSVLKWGLQPFTVNTQIGEFITRYSEGDYTFSLTGYQDDGRAKLEKITYTGLDQTAPSGAGAGGTASSFCGNLGSQAFAMAIDLEASNGVEISGLNAEEQSDISLVATYYKEQDSSFNIEVYCYYDALIILKENNVIDLIQ